MTYVLPAEQLRPQRYTIPADLPEDEKVLLERARKRIERYEKRMVALSRAASERWRPAQSVYDTDETASAVFGDEEYADFLHQVEVMADLAQMRIIGSFLGMPRAALDAITLEKLRHNLLPPDPVRTGLPFSVRRSRSDG